MATKELFVHSLWFDPDTPYLSVFESEAYTGKTEDEGQTVTFPIGYLPNTPNSQYGPPSEIRRTLVSLPPPPVELPLPRGVTRFDDWENGITTLTFT
jgi:hypothetical protein